MRLLMVALCALFGAGVFATMLLALWSTRGRVRRAPLRQSRVAEFVWTAIPCLLLLAAAIPAVAAIVSAHQPSLKVDRSRA